MNQRLLLALLALEMFASPVFAQEKEYQIESDGYEWYRVKRTVNDQTKYGVEDRYGNMIIPVEYEGVYYPGGLDQIETGFFVSKGDYYGWYNKSGKCIIPYTRHYTFVLKNNKKDWGTYYWVTRDDGSGICDMNGKELVFIKGAGNVYPKKKKSRGGQVFYYYLIDKKGCHDCENKWGVADANGNIVITPEYKNITDNQIFKFVKTTNNPFKGNRSETIAESEGQYPNTKNVYSSSSSSNSSSSSTSSSNNSSNNNNSGGGTTKIVVEHQHTPQPVQEWQACFGCGGMGTMGCDNCGGSGTKYIGDRLHRCSRCNGQGIIPCNVCYGNKGQYITVYK